MSSTSGNVEHQGFQSWSRCGSNSARTARWSGINIAAMVVGFVFFWPVGLVVLFWIMSGRQVQELPGAVREQWVHFFGGGKTPVEVIDNRVFNEYQQTQYDRIREIKEEIKHRAQRFTDFRNDAQRRADQEEFDRFMASNPTASKASRNA